MNYKKIASLDFVRAISVLFIIIFHYCAIILFDQKIDINISRYVFPLFGALGVSFFIIISGGGIYNSIKKDFRLMNFYKKRLLSIYPTYYVAYAITVLLLFVISGRVIFQGDISNLLWTLLGLDGFLSSRVNTYYLIGEWFLGFIIIMYFLFPIIRFFYIKNRYATFLAAIAISLLSVHYNSFLYEYVFLWNKRDIWNPLARLPEFILGMYLFEIISENKRSAIKAITLIALFVISIYLIHDHRDMVINEFRNIPFFCSVLVLMVLTFEYLFKIIHFNHIISFLSKYSFLAFLYHHQVLSVINAKVNLHAMDKTGLIFCGIIAICISFILAYITADLCVRFSGYVDSKLLNIK